MTGWLGALVLSATVLLVAMTIVAYLTWIERKVAARFQNRIGPYQVGVPHGWLQPLADVLKLIVKEDITPRSADPLLFNLAPVMVVAPALIGFAFIPLAPGLAVVDHPYSYLFFTAFASLTLLGIFAAGWSSNNKYALLSALRMVAMVASYEIPLLLTLLVPAVFAGSFRLTDVVEAQRGLWFIAAPVVGQVAFLVFLVCALAEGNKVPLDLIEAESELIAAYNVEYSGIKFALFYAGEYAHTLAICALAATVFLGGYLGPAFLPGVVWL
ncbi:MAG TPA: complex I subunit 1 family protein, partial [Candidatus Sulfotelmatobacter sp.]|nr:complex I subunit 1 family protein [Candidatus Sulfotelmatobacter sp.]